VSIRTVKMIQYWKYVFLFVLFLVVTYSLLYLVYENVRYEMIGNLNARQTVHAKQAARGIETFFQEHIAILTELARNNHIVLLDPDGRKMMQECYKSHAKEIGIIARIDNRSRTIYTVPYAPGGIHQPVTQMEDFQKVRKTRQVVVSNVFTNRRGFQAIVVQAPVFKNGAFDGTLSMLFWVNQIAFHYIRDIRIGQDGYAWVIGKNGIEISCPVPGHIGHSIFTHCRAFPDILAMAKSMVRGEHGTATYRFNRLGENTVGPVTKHAVFMPIYLEDTFWSIAVATPEGEVTGALEDFRNKLIMIAVLLLIGMAELLYVLFRNNLLVKEIEKRKSAEEQLRLQALVLDQIEDRVTVTDLAGNITYVNESESSSLGYPREEIIGRNVEVYGDDSDKGATQKAIIQETLTHGAWRGEVVNYTKDGRKIIMDCRTQLVRDVAGVPIAMAGFATDITQRKQVEEALRESEHRFKELSDLLPEVVFEADRNMRLTFANRKAFSLFGYSEEDLKEGFFCLDLLSPEDRKRGRENIQKRMAGFDTGSSEYTALRKDGSALSVLISSTAIRQNGKPIGIRGIIMDITERKKAEEAQRESEQMIGSILSTTPVGIGLTVDRKIKWVNEAWMQIFGFREENEYMDQPVGMLYSSEDSYEESRRRIYTILENTQIARIEAPMARRDGTPFQAHISVAPLDPSNLKKGSISAITDISEWKKMEQSLRKSEEKYRLAMNATSDGLWDWDVTTGEVYYSPAWFHILGEEIDNHISAWQSRLHPDERDAVLRSFSNHLDGRSEGWSHEHRLRQSTEKWKWVLGRGSVISRDATGKALRMVGTICDIEDRKRLESQLIQAQKMEAIGTLAGGIAHDFNNILASISGYTELFIMKEHRQDNYLLQVMKACERAKNLVNQILLFSRQREGEKKPVDVKIIVREALQLLRASLPSTIKINSSVSPDASMVMADSTHIHQIVMNLCTNAAHAMRENGGLLEVSVSNLLISDDMTLTNPDFQVGPHIHLQVTDSGQGIAPQIMDKIFDPFFTTKKLEEGTGLGLSVVYGIVKSYEGVIHVESKCGQGSTFDIYLPRLTVENVIKGKETDPSPPRGNECILVIDDEKDLVITMQKYLAALGYDVVTSTGSLDALNIFHKNPHRFDLIITDMTMPQMTGLKLSQEILSIRPEIPIILCTGYYESITEAETKRHGIRELVMKPIRLSEYSQLIRKSLDN